MRFLFMRFSYSLLPIALFYHLAHNLQHIFFEGKKLVRIASDPFGWGWDLFGTADMLVDAVLPVSIGRGCWIGEHVVIMPGVTIGEFSIVGANSVISTDIPPRSIAVGSPGKVVKTWSEKDSQWVNPDAIAQT